jgi:hypothetical protein
MKRWYVMERGNLDAYRSLIFLCHNFHLHFCDKMAKYTFPSTFVSRPTSLLASIRGSVFFLIVHMLSLSRFTSSASTRSYRVPSTFSPTWFSWTFLMVYSIAKLTSTGDKASPSFRPSEMGKLSCKCLSTWTLL